VFVNKTVSNLVLRRLACIVWVRNVELEIHFTGYYGARVE